MLLGHCCWCGRGLTVALWSSFDNDDEYGDDDDLETHLKLAVLVTAPDVCSRI